MLKSQKILIVVFLWLIVLGTASCSASRDIKKKCRECPKFTNITNCCGDSENARP
jgi:hypothetical protein